jgi:hypothetical protein
MKTCRFLVLAVAVALSGCISEYKPAPMPASPPQKAAAAAEQSGPQARAGPQTAAQVSPSAPQLPRNVSARETAAAREMPIQVSTGVALAQTLTDGTTMGFSVIYKFLREEPQPSAQYVWVIERAWGEPAKTLVPLKPEGTLYTFPPWRPEEGPFRGHFEDRSGNRLSRSIDLLPPGDLR